MNQIRQYLEETVTVSDTDWELFASKLVRQEFPKGHNILRVGQVENHLSFVEEGIIRFYIPQEENSVTFTFVFDHHFVSAYDSFLTRTPSTYHVETLTKTTLWRLTYSDLQLIYRETDIGNTMGRLAVESLFLRKTKREISLLNESAEQRYLALLEEEPHLLQHIPLKYIASYIGVTPQALSRIRKRIC